MLEVLEGDVGKRKRSTRNTNKTCAHVITRAADLEPSDLDHSADRAPDQARRDEVTLDVWAHVCARDATEEEGRHDETADHGERVLQTENQDEEVWQAVVDAVEGQLTPLKAGQVGDEEGGIVLPSASACLARWAGWVDALGNPQPLT